VIRPDGVVLVRSRTPFQGYDWDSRRKGLPKSNNDTNQDFINSSDWQLYFQRYRPAGMCFICVLDDRSKFGLRSRIRKNGDIDVTVGVPAEMFLGDVAKQDVYREIIMRTYTWAAEKFRWPPPPPLPPLTVKRTYRKNYRPLSE